LSTGINNPCFNDSKKSCDKPLIVKPPNIRHRRLIQHY